MAGAAVPAVAAEEAAATSAAFASVITAPKPVAAAELFAWPATEAELFAWPAGE